MTERPSCSRLQPGENDDLQTTTQTPRPILAALAMTVRTTRTSVTVKAPFQLPGSEELPAGTYAVDTGEEPFGGNVRTVYHRVDKTQRVRKCSGSESSSLKTRDLEQALQHEGLTSVEQGAGNIGGGHGNALVPNPSTNLWRWVPLWVRNSRPDGRSS